MTARVERVRVGLIAGSVLLLVVLAGLFGFARYRASKSWLDKLKKRSGASLVRETNGFTYSQSLKGKTVFTLHAAKAFQHSDGHWILHDVVITLYGLREDRADRVYGSDFEWDENEGVARAVGEVQMDLQVPSGVVTTPRRGSPATAEGDATSNSIHVRTRGLVFVRKLGVAATQEQIEFHYGGLTCVARGAEFDSNPSALHLLADVQMNGEMQGKPMALTAAKADFDRTSNLASFTLPVLVSQERRARAESALLHLRKDGSVERAEAMGAVTLDADTTHLSAPRLEAVLSEKNVPQTARLLGGVKMRSEDAARPSEGEAAEMRMRFDARGQPAEVTAAGDARLTAREADGKGIWLAREMRGDRLVAEFSASEKGRAELRQVHATGGAMMRGDSLASAPSGAAGAARPGVRDTGVRAAGVRAAGVQTTSVSGDDLVLNLATIAGGKARLDSLHGQGHTVLRQTGALDELRVSSGDVLDVTFAGVAGGKDEQAKVATAAQVGHVAIENRAARKAGKAQEVANGKADRAMYTAASERLSLNGGVHLADGGTSLVAASVELDQATGDAEARGDVTATLPGNSSEATHVAAQTAVLHKASQVAEFTGSAAKPARMWQAASQVEAASIVLDRQKNTLVARPAGGGTVRSVFASESKGKDSGASMPGILRVESRSLDYSETLHQATFSGPVRMEGALGEVSGQRTTVYFTPTAKGAVKSRPGEGLMGGGLERVVVAGEVKLSQPGRQGMGEQLVYKAADGSFVLTGSAGAPPRMLDAQQGSVTGASLLFRAGGGERDSTIVVAGAPAAGAERAQRARIETRVRQKPE